MRSSWGAVSTTETLSSLKANLEESGLTTEYTDEDIYNPRYTTTLNFNNLADTTYTFSAGLYFAPTEQLGISASYLHGGSFNHTGDLDLSFSCPPEEDVLGSFGASLTGTCYAELSGQGSVGYNFPWRTNVGIRWMPTGEPDRFAIELMGAYINWSDFTDYEISTDVDPDTVDLEDEAARESTAATVSQNRSWARDNQNTYWVGVDVKRRIANDKVLLGGRVLYDRAAIPDTTVAANNIDADTIIPGGLGAFRITDALELGVSYSHYFLAKCETSTSAFATTLDAANANEDRYFYPSANGSYKVSISRLGVNLTGHFGRKAPRPLPPEVTDAVKQLR